MYIKIDDIHKARLDFENSGEFSNKLSIRHKTEEKTVEMKTAHGYRRADSVGLVAMRLQAYFTAIVYYKQTEPQQHEAVAALSRHIITLKEGYTEPVPFEHDWTCRSG